MENELIGLTEQHKALASLISSLPDSWDSDDLGNAIGYALGVRGQQIDLQELTDGIAHGLNLLRSVPVEKIKELNREVYGDKVDEPMDRTAGRVIPLHEKS